MNYKLDLKHTWRYRHPKKGVVEVSIGIYAVPESISDTAAQLAIAQGVATRIDVPKASPPLAPQNPPAAKPKRRYTRRAKRSPEDKMRGNAPENKSTLV